MKKNKKKQRRKMIFQKCFWEKALKYVTAGQPVNLGICVIMVEFRKVKNITCIRLQLNL